MSWVPSGSTNRLNSCSEPQVENSTHRGSSAKPNRLRMLAVEWSRSAENVELPSILAVPSTTDRRCPSVPTTRKTEPAQFKFEDVGAVAPRFCRDAKQRPAQCRVDCRTEDLALRL